MRLFGKKTDNDLESRFRAALSGDKSLHQPAVDFILNGKPYPIDQRLTNSQGRPVPDKRIHRQFSGAGTFSGNWIATMGVAADLDEAAVTRLVDAVAFHQRRDWLSMTIDQARSMQSIPFTLADVELVGAPLGVTKDAILAMLMSQAKWGRQNVAFAKFGDIDSWVANNIESVRSYLAEPSAASVGSWDIVGLLQPNTIKLLSKELARAATGTSKELRSTARPIIRKLSFTDCKAELKLLATEGDSSTRAQAVGLLGELAPPELLEEVLAWAHENCGQDRAKSVRDAVSEIGSISAGRDRQPEIELPELDFSLKWPTAAIAAGERQAAVNTNLGRTLKDFFAGETSNRSWAIGMILKLLSDEPRIADELQPSHWARIALSGGSNTYGAHNVLKVIEISGGSPTPLEMQLGSQITTDTPESATHRVVNVLACPAFSAHWPQSEIEAWALHNLAALEDFLTEGQSWHWDIEGVFKAIESIDQRPHSLGKALLDCAVAGPKLSQGRARQLLGNDSPDAVIPYLAAGKVAERVGAASWLREIRDPSAEPALRKALKKEKQDLAKTQMMAALEACGASIDEFTSPKALLAEATKALSKKNAIPSSLDWLPAESIPPVRWADGSPVDANVLLWFMASAVKAKSAEPSPLMRRHFANMNNEDVRQLGRTLFDLWTSHDTRGASKSEIESEARKEAKRLMKYATENPTYTHVQGKTEDIFFAEYMHRFESYPPSHSGSDSKGVLAVVGASGAASLAPKVLSYLKTHRGRRLSQGKAMLQMLSWMDDPAATQVLLSVSQRFRPKGLNKQATIYAEELANRNGWTLDDLADRTVPEAGFNSEGRQVIDYGERTFTAHLSDELTINLVNDETGKTIKSLPAPRTAEDEAEVKDVKKDFAAAKKELKATAALQPTRLHQAMCIQRTWNADDFTRYLVSHPVMCRLASRLVWWTAIGDGPKTLFRPLTDTTLIAVDDEAIALDPESTVGIAHEIFASVGDGEAWHQHMSDYEVAPLFPQFNRPAVTADDKNLIEDFKGFMMPEGTFRSQMNTYAWELGAAQDGGWVGEIVKDFQGVSLKAVFEHTGVSAGYFEGEDLKVGFTFLYFTHAHVYPTREAAISLDTVPPILLSEMYAEAQAIANGGSFDPDWEKKCGY